MLKIDKTSYKGWENCFRISNEIVELIALADVGPRIIHIGFLDGENHFAVVEETLGECGGCDWQVYGGHRLWHAPEETPRTYYPDNYPVPAEIEGDTLKLSQDVEETTGVKKEIEISLDSSEPKVEIVHRLANTNLWPIQLAPWALSVMAPGGRAVVPLPPRGPHPENLLPTSSIAIWPYTNMADPRWHWGSELIFLDQDKDHLTPQKAGFYVTDGWMMYQRGAEVFVKQFEYDPEGSYPDRNSNVELYTDANILELETLGSLVTLAKDEQVILKETWQLRKGIEPITTEEDAKAVISKIITE